MLTNEQESVLELARSMLNGSGMSEYAARLDEPESEAKSIPAGWKIVPIEPDLKMVISGENCIGRHAWKKMLEAAPEPDGAPLAARGLTYLQREAIELAANYLGDGRTADILRSILASKGA